jgi:hypothetical protein
MSIEQVVYILIFNNISLFSMKTKFLLGLLTLNSLIFYANSVFAATGSAIESSQKITNLSQSIAKSIDLNGDYHSLIESAIGRALLAKGEKGSKLVNPTVAGGLGVSPPNSRPSGPIVNGKIAQPNPRHSNPPVIINGIIKKVDPQTKK